MIKNLKIKTQLMLGFGVMLVFFILLGLVARHQTYQMNQKAEIMFSHPYMVRSALGSLVADILTMRLSSHNLMDGKNGQGNVEDIKSFKLAANEALDEFRIIKELFLGPKDDIDEAYKAYITWMAALENSGLSLSETDIKSGKSIGTDNEVKAALEKLMAAIQKIDAFAKDKAITLNANSEELYLSLNEKLLFLTAIITFLALLIGYYLVQAIRLPVGQLIDAANRFKKGDKNARSSYQSQNEFGILSDSFNSMVFEIQKNAALNDNVATLATLMLSEYDPLKFFRVTLKGLKEHTNSQMVAIYLLSQDKKTYEHFESIGLSRGGRESFDASIFEGEFGAAISTGNVQHIKNIDENTRFIFNAVSGRFIPKEIITLPIVIDHEVVAILSLARLGQYTLETIQLIDRIKVVLSARIEGVLAYAKMKEFSQKLENQNRELEVQKTEMASQSDELTEQNRELEMQKKQLDEASRLKTSFLSNMSHELRTPLNSVIALSGVLNRRLDKKIPDEEYSYLEVIERNGKHLLSLINDILDISRIEAGREEVEITRFNLSNLISDLTGMIRPQAEQKNVNLLFADNDQQISIVSDFDKCRHVLQNLIGNAVKFTEEGKVEIIASQRNEIISIKVTDTGIGILENHLSHIFDEFRQADGSTSRRFGGSGLGLAIAKKYASLLGGTISVNSTYGKGSVFTLTLPACYAIENRHPDSEEIFDFKYPVKANQNYNEFDSQIIKTILLVEDSEPAIIQLKDILGESGHQVLVARNGSEALEIIAKTIPDTMILDLMMPGIDGFEVLRTLREAEPTAHIPVLILTAKQITKEELRFLKRNNVHQLIQKGDVNRAELLSAVNSMVYQKITSDVKPQRELQIIEGKPVVLVVEDNQDNMITVKALLSDDYVVLEAVDGVAGIDMAKKHRPNLILMDIALPEMDGIEAFKRIRNHEELHHIAVIALTASAMTSDRDAILAHGFDAYIAKPIDEKLFFKTINHVLYGR
jgi:signal transduction histidine kinase/CheY-like chemotaxis protein